ncbi:protein of unknown function (plasmid) [Cupriavidus taiwanensis]|uniref:Uncharacterized protein n=1 Tax=Cupriavidus taiwanensis TaxID=164546 RepID=A0A375FHN6_9BURK|nr:protein of unknown function [Cupriavidus taiwanensis]SOZ74852.1 protein of unknown function [Cupriavidus taiwanensis]SPA03652.1 protein of unknown function [Cupriavidus taiwanensis]SPA57457.1 protein of unknown function [Cupriavidus taiwanensis]SPD49287.1 protein of unknown function [Cupriavidus taiwanensis]
MNLNSPYLMSIDSVLHFIHLPAPCYGPQHRKCVDSILALARLHASSTSPRRGGSASIVAYNLASILNGVLVGPGRNVLNNAPSCLQRL